MNTGGAGAAARGTRTTARAPAAPAGSGRNGHRTGRPKVVRSHLNGDEHRVLEHGRERRTIRGAAGNVPALEMPVNVLSRRGAG